MIEQVLQYLLITIVLLVVLLLKSMEKVKTEGVITVEEAKGQIPQLKLLRECSSTEDIFLHISLQMQTKWKLN